MEQHKTYPIYCGHRSGGIGDSTRLEFVGPDRMRITVERGFYPYLWLEGDEMSMRALYEHSTMDELERAYERQIAATELAQ